MPKTDYLVELLDQLEIFIRYAVPADEVEKALGFAKKFSFDMNMTRLLHEHYRSLPDVKEESVVQVARLVQRRGVGLFVVSTLSTPYLYAVSNEEILYLGEYSANPDNEIFATLGVESKKELAKICLPPDQLKPYWGEQKAGVLLCPVCGASEGENHLLGCVVELCPWCDEHLSTCNCRFEHLSTESIDDEKQLEEFVDLLEAKGRIPFKSEQAPAYPGTSKGFDKE